MLWQEFLKLKKNGEPMIEFLNKVDNIGFELQSAHEKISDNLKTAIVLKAFPENYDSFIAAIQFQQISYLQLKELKLTRYQFYVNCGFIKLIEEDTMDELDRETRKPCVVGSVDVTITLLTGAMQSIM